MAPSLPTRAVLGSFDSLPAPGNRPLKDAPPCGMPASWRTTSPCRGALMGPDTLRKPLDNSLIVRCLWGRLATPARFLGRAVTRAAALGRWALQPASRLFAAADLSGEFELQATGTAARP